VNSSISPSDDGSYVDVFVPIAFKRFGGRKVIVAPDGKPVLPDRSKATDTTLTKALARACRWQKLLDDGTQPETLRLADLEAPFSIDWHEQRAAFGFTAEHGPSDGRDD
jgi:hypothetical protein